MLPLRRKRIKLSVTIVAYFVVFMLWLINPFDPLLPVLYQHVSYSSISIGISYCTRARPSDSVPNKRYGQTAASSARLVNQCCSSSCIAISANSPYIRLVKANRRNEGQTGLLGIFISIHFNLGVVPEACRSLVVDYCFHERLFLVD